MIQLSGTYDNGNIILDSTVEIDHPAKVIVTFVEEEAPVQKRLTRDDFSFAKSRELLKDVHIDLAAAVIEERRAEL